MKKTKTKEKTEAQEKAQRERIAHIGPNYADAPRFVAHNIQLLDCLHAAGVKRDEKDAICHLTELPVDGTYGRNIVHPSNDYIAKWAYLDRSKVPGVMRKLQAMHLIRMTHQGAGGKGNSNHYDITVLRQWVNWLAGALYPLRPGSGRADGSRIEMTNEEATFFKQDAAEKRLELARCRNLELADFRGHVLAIAAEPIDQEEFEESELGARGHFSAPMVATVYPKFFDGAQPIDVPGLAAHVVNTFFEDQKQKEAWRAKRAATAQAGA